MPQKKKSRYSEKNHLLPTAMFGSVRMELSGNRRAVVEGCRGILEYQHERVRIRTGGMITCFSGRNLTIRSMNREAFVVEGFILSIEFIV